MMQFELQAGLWFVKLTGAEVAQMVEHSHGKGKAVGSNPTFSSGYYTT